MFKRIAIFLCLVLCATAGNWCRAAQGRDSLRVTLLTCSPGPEIYELYGHTAIRIQKTGEPFDFVFNYGVFDMSKPHFAWHFLLGECDYMVQSIPWQYFIREYDQRGSTVTEHELNLTPSEAQKLLSRLLENCEPENRQYRYNFLYKNCTTMVRDMVEDVIVGNILYPNSLHHQTYREILHHYTKGHPWAQEGNDLLLGAGMDTILSQRAAMFVPAGLMRAFEGAYIRTPRGDMRPLVKNIVHSPLLFREGVTGHYPPGRFGGEKGLLPWEVMLAFGGLCILIVLLEAWLNRIFWGWDVLLLLLQGAAGTFVTFMFLFSTHPGTGSNWQVWVLNPIALIGIPLVIKSAIKHKPTRWYAFQFAVLALFLLLSPWIPQVFAQITVPLALCLLTRPVSYYLLKVKE